MNRENLMAKASNVDGRMIPDMRKKESDRRETIDGKREETDAGEAPA